VKKQSLQKISDHVYWMPPAKPDRPSLCAVVGKDEIVMLDAGASDAHARAFLDQLSLLGMARPKSVVLTHWHWDHVVGVAELGAQVIAQTQTAEKLIELSRRDWSDAGLARLVAEGRETKEGAENIRTELPAPRKVRIVQPDVVFRDTLELRLGSVTCRIEHVGGDHAADSSVGFVQPDRVLFLGDCLYGVFYATEQYYTIQRLNALLDRIQEFEADHYVEGHNPVVLTRAEFDEEISMMREAVEVIQEIGSDEEKAFATVAASTGRPPDENMAYYLRALIVGLSLH
jgi:glyoxylase-like metal-dependent hydrolase (beta-lactamase superfamily II)